jgi:SAM-dependent methyltransferase
MRNLLDQGPSRELHGIQAHAARLVRPDDLADRTVLDVGCGFGWFELYVDTIVCWEVLEHLPEGSERAAFAEFRRVLRAGGMLYLSTPYASWRAQLLDPAWWLIGHRHYRLDQLDRLARDGGLRPELIEARGAGWQIVAILNLYVAKWVFRRPPFLERRVAQRWDDELRRPGGYANCFLKAHR